MKKRSSKRNYLWKGHTSPEKKSYLGSLEGYVREYNVWKGPHFTVSEFQKLLGQKNVLPYAACSRSDNDGAGGEPGEELRRTSITFLSLVSGMRHAKGLEKLKRNKREMMNIITSTWRMRGEGLKGE